jgi:hypothetical protein
VKPAVLVKRDALIGLLSFVFSSCVTVFTFSVFYLSSLHLLFSLLCVNITELIKAEVENGSNIKVSGNWK